MALKISFAICLVVTVTFLARLPSAASRPWPEPNALIGLWPFDSEFGLWDVDRVQSPSTWNPKIMTAINGPFGEPSSSYSVACDSCRIVEYSKIPLTSKFTLSFYYYSKMDKQSGGGILQFKYGSNLLSLNSVPPNILEIWGGPEKGKLIGRFNLLTANAWNYIAITYDASSQAMIFHNEYGDRMAVTWTNAVGSNAESLLTVGFSNWGNGSVLMQTTDAIACMMLYNTTLTPSQISELPYHCQTKGRGTSKAPTTTSATSLIQPWPKSEALVGLWPLTYHYAWQDISPNHHNGPFSTSQKYTSGPFGVANTATVPPGNNSQVFYINNPSMFSSESFTVSLFLSRRQSGGQGGIFEFADTFNSKNAFQFRYENDTTIEVSANGRTVGHYTVIQQKGVWTFIAFAYDAENEVFFVYTKHGIFSIESSNAAYIEASSTFNQGGIRLGYASRWGQGLQTTDAVACLAIYDRALLLDDILQLQDACRVIQGAPLCGSPKVPLSPIPSSLTSNGIPKEGQFPYVAVLSITRGGSSSSPEFICSATIIDEYWLLTSAGCFTDSNNSSLFSVHVGVHDTSLPEEHTVRHKVSKIMLRGTNARDVALVEVEEPIDFTSDYVNNACLYRYKMTTNVDLDKTEFLVGWGKNGRPSLASESLPRYIPGEILGNSQCAELLSDGSFKAGSDLCFLSASADKSAPCEGDEGSPLLVQVDANVESGLSDRLIQVGVYYSRDPACSADKPGLIADMNDLYDWIWENIACSIPGVIYYACPQK